MADRSTHFTEPFQFHPCDTPRGMEYFDLPCLTKAQQKRLNNHKIEVSREHQKYLNKNPQIRAILQIIMRKLLMERPSHDIERFIGHFFAENWQAISQEVDKYCETMPSKPVEDTSKVQVKDERHVTIDQERLLDDISIASSRTSADHHLILRIVQDILDEMIDNLHEFQPKKVQTADTAEIIEEKSKLAPDKSDDEDDELIFDLGLDFELDFSAYHDEDDSTIIQSLSADTVSKPTPQF